RPTTPDQGKHALHRAWLIMPGAEMRPPWGRDGAQAEPRSVPVLPPLLRQGRIPAPTSSAVARHRYAVSPFTGRHVRRGAEALDYAADSAVCVRTGLGGRARARGRAG